MKILAKVALVASFSFLIYAPLIYAAEFNSRCCDEEYPKLIVYGEGKIETLADKAKFKINIRVEEKKLEQAFESSGKKINSINSILNSFNVKKEDIENLGYVYHPLYEGKKIFTTIDRPTSYEVVYTIKVTIYNMDNLGKILTALSEVSETTVYGFEYTSTKIEELKKEVLKKAAVDAREKAMQLAEGTGATLGKVIKIESGVQSYSERVFEEQGTRMLMKAEKPKETPQIESGYLEILGNCTVYYSIQ